MRMPLFNRENKIKALYERMIVSMTMHDDFIPNRKSIISRSQYWLAACKPSLWYTSLVLVAGTSKKLQKTIKNKILKHQENVNLTAASILKVYFLAVYLQARFSKLVSIFDRVQFAAGSSAGNIILGFAFPLSLPHLCAHSSMIRISETQGWCFLFRIKVLLSHWVKLKTLTESVCKIMSM